MTEQKLLALQGNGIKAIEISGRRKGDDLIVKHVPELLAIDGPELPSYRPHESSNDGIDQG